MKRTRRVLHQTRYLWLKETIENLQDDYSKDWDQYPCLEWPFSIGSPGYGTMTVDYQTVTSNRAAFELVYGPLKEGECALHFCDNRKCFRPIHLFRGTKSDNTRDMLAKGRNNTTNHRRGSEHGMAKLTESDIVVIRALLESGVKGAALARKFSVGESTISRIKLRRCWL